MGNMEQHNNGNLYQTTGSAQSAESCTEAEVSSKCISAESCTETEVSSKCISAESCTETEVSSKCISADVAETHATTTKETFPALTNSSTTTWAKRKSGRRKWIFLTCAIAVLLIGVLCGVLIFQRNTSISPTEGIVYAVNGDHAEVLNYTGSATDIRIATTYTNKTWTRTDP